LDDSKISPSNLDLLVSALDENFPLVEYQEQRASTEFAIFIIISKLLDNNLVELAKEDQLNAFVKEHLKGKLGWADRICQRIRYVIPFV